MGPHTADPQRPLEQHKAGCHTTWPVVHRAERSSRIQNLHRAEHQSVMNDLWKVINLNLKSADSVKLHSVVQQFQTKRLHTFLVTEEVRNMMYSIAAVTHVLKWSNCTNKTSTAGNAS